MATPRRVCRLRDARQPAHRPTRGSHRLPRPLSPISCRASPTFSTTPRTPTGTVSSPKTHETPTTRRSYGATASASAPTNKDDYVRALAFDLLPINHREAAADRLVELIDAAHGHLGTGFLSTPLLLPVLTTHGRPDVAYRVAMQDTSPSWLAQITAGATTIWETWEGHDGKGRAKDSHNHYAFGTIAQWLVEHVAGLRPIEPGYRRFHVDPTAGGGLTNAGASVTTPWGTAETSWTVNPVRHL